MLSEGKAPPSARKAETVSNGVISGVNEVRDKSPQQMTRQELAEMRREKRRILRQQRDRERRQKHRAKMLEEQRREQEERARAGLPDPEQMQGGIIPTYTQRLEAEAAYFEAAKKRDKRLKKDLYRMLSVEQRDRYSVFRRGYLKKKDVNKITLAVLGRTKVSEPFTNVMCGIAKVFVCDIVEKAVKVMNEWDHNGQIRPLHIREAHRRLHQAGKIPTFDPHASVKRTSTSTRLFRR